jgi:hypothetical protein
MQIAAPATGVNAPMIAATVTTCRVKLHVMIKKNIASKIVHRKQVTWKRCPELVISINSDSSSYKRDDLFTGALMIESHEFEAWAMTRAHEIMMREGLQLALSAQNLDKRKVRNDSYRLRQAIADCLMEMRSLPHAGHPEKGFAQGSISPGQTK